MVEELLFQFAFRYDRAQLLDAFDSQLMELFVAAGHSGISVVFEERRLNDLEVWCDHLFAFDLLENRNENGHLFFF